MDYRNIGARLAGVFGSTGQSILSDATTTAAVGAVFDRNSHRQVYGSLAVLTAVESTNLSNTKTATVTSLVEDATASGGPWSSYSTGPSKVFGSTTTSTANPTPSGVHKHDVNLNRANRYIRVTPSVAFSATSSIDAVRVQSVLAFAVESGEEPTT